MTTIARPTPFLRWAGGKSKILPLLEPLLPPPSEYTRYVEPFLGSGALFFHIAPKVALLADANPHLINCFRQVARRPREVSLLLEEHLRHHSRDFYLSVRQLGLRHGSPVERAARFIYLNKTAFNGIFRVNKAGNFNVPFGPSQSGPAIPTEQSLLAASAALRHARLLAAHFETTCKLAQKGDFVYLDPPYPPLAPSSNFTHYTPGRFGPRDQERVAAAFRELDKKGCLVMLSNSDQHHIRALYRGFTVTPLRVTRWLGANGKRFQAREIVVTNY